MIRLLLFSSLFPNRAMPRHGIFVENRLRHLLAQGDVTAQVVAPVPWAPWPISRLSDTYRGWAGAPAADTRHGIEIRYPRYLTLPKIGMHLQPLFMYLAARAHLARRFRAGERFDLIDAHYFYPDGVAAALLGRRFDLPVTITARGTDLNLIPQHPGPRRMIRWAAEQAAHTMTVCQALKDVLVDDLGIAADHCTVLRNGVDLTMFTPPGDRTALRAELGISGPTLLSVGHLIERKGHHLVIDSLKSLPDTRLLIAGDGPEQAALQRQIAQQGLGDRVRLLGAVPHGELARYYGAADALVLASSREGWANVLLEAMACGTPVVATRIWGTPEVVAKPEAGRLAPDRTADSLAETTRALLADPPARAATRRYAEQFSWDATSAGQMRIFERIIAGKAAA